MANLGAALVGQRQIGAADASPVTADGKAMADEPERQLGHGAPPRAASTAR